MSGRMKHALLMRARSEPEAESRRIRTRLCWSCIHSSTDVAVTVQSDTLMVTNIIVPVFIDEFCFSNMKMCMFCSQFNRVSRFTLTRLCRLFYTLLTIYFSSLFCIRLETFSHFLDLLCRFKSLFSILCHFVASLYVFVPLETRCHGTVSPQRLCGTPAARLTWMMLVPFLKLVKDLMTS